MTLMTDKVEIWHRGQSDPALQKASKQCPLQGANITQIFHSETIVSLENGSKGANFSNAAI